MFDRIIINFWNNIICDKQIFDKILQQNDKEVISLILKILNKEEVKEFIVNHDKKEFDKYFAQTIEQFKKGKIKKEQIKDTYLRYSDKDRTYIANFNKEFNAKYNVKNNIQYEQNTILINNISEMLEKRLLMFDKEYKHRILEIDKMIEERCNQIDENAFTPPLNKLIKMSKK